MKAFTDLKLEDQAALVLLCLLEDVANESRTMAGVEHHIHMLYAILENHFDVPDQEVEAVVSAVARSGVEMLPAFTVEPKTVRGYGAK